MLSASNMPTPDDEDARIVNEAIFDIEKVINRLTETQTILTIGYLLSKFGENKIDTMVNHIKGVAYAAAWGRQWGK